MSIMQSFRSTKTKRMVIHTLTSTTLPVSLHELYEQVNKAYPGTAFSTIFRIVRRLEEEQKVIRVDWRERASRYEWAERPHHHHILCNTCGLVTDIDDSLLNFNGRNIHRKTGYRVTDHTIELQGICRRCQNKEA